MEKNKSSGSQPFHKNICKLIMGANILENNVLVINLFTDEMTSTSICLVRAWYTGLEAWARAPILSHHRTGEENKGTYISLNIIRNQYNSVIVRAIARYSTSILDRATTGCFLAIQDTRQDPRKMP